MIFLTGANGWLGLNVAATLQNGRAAELGLDDARIRGLILPDSDKAKLQKAAPRMEIAEGNVTSGSGLEAFFNGGNGGVLLHTVGIIHPRSVAEFYAINVEGTRHVLDSAIKAGVKRAVLISSNSPFGCNPHSDHLFDEASPYNPYMNYGRSKMQMELLVKEYQAAGKIETVLVRAPWFYGPHQPARQVLFFEMIRDGKGPIVGSGENLRSMAFTENLAEGMLLCAAKAPAGEAYWIADERPYSMIEIMDTIERLLETEFGQKCAHKRMRLPGIASEVAWFIDWLLQSAGMYHQKIHVLSEMNKTIACSIEKAKRELGYAPKVALEEGMRRSLAEYFPRTGSSSHR
ncbi:MAG: NAD-dependent epimerase/dehydratase family protein [Candidatus Methylacidiphilales bacterium]|nr:NAD(P)-dependent oxidoreductase [Candidatus Methylacidiphilales bacterium]